MTEPLLLTIGDVAKELSCSTRLVEKLIHSGDLKSVRLGRRARRVPRSAVTDYIDGLLGDQVTELLSLDAEPNIARHANAKGWTPRRSKKEARTSGTPATGV